MMAPLPPPPAPPPPPMNFAGPPPPPPPVNLKTSPSRSSKATSNSGADRNALLLQIRGGAKLKKAVTNDRSQPLIDGKSSQAKLSTNSSPQVGGGIKSPNGGIVNGGGPPNLGGIFSQGMPKLRPTGMLNPARDETEDSLCKSTAAQSARETSPSSLSGTPKRTANFEPSSTPINKSPINSVNNSTIKASLEAQFQLQQNGIHRNGSGNNSSSLTNNNNNNNNNYNSKFNTISATRPSQSQWKVSPTSNSNTDQPNQQTHGPINSYSKGPAPSVPSPNMANDSSTISAQLTSNNRPGSVNRSKSVGLKPSQRPAHPAVRPPPPPKTTGINAVTLQSNTTSIPVNVSQSSINNFVSRRTSLDPSSVAEEGSTVAPVSNKPPPPPRNIPVTHGPPLPLVPHGRATGSTGLTSGLSKSQSSINGPSRPSAPPPPPPPHPHSRTPSNVSVSSSNLSTILKPAYPAPPPPAPLNTSNRTHVIGGQIGQINATLSNQPTFSLDLATRFSLQFKDLVTLPRPDPMTKTNKQYASVIYQAKQQSREPAHHC